MKQFSRTKNRDRSEVHTRWWEYVALLALTLWLVLVFASLLEWDAAGNLIVHSYSIWGDWSAHFTFISTIRERGIGAVFGDNPLFPGRTFQYPFLSHLITALIGLVTTLDVVRATYYTSFLLILALPATLYYFYRKLTLSPFASFASLLSFLLIGGFQWMSSDLDPSQPLTNQFDKGSIFTQFILFEFIPQRAFLFGLLAFTGLVILVMRKKNWSIASLIFLGIGISLLALIHVHTWIAAALLLFCTFLFPETPARTWMRKPLFIFGLSVAALSAVVLGFLLLRGNSDNAALSWSIWYPGWAQNENAGMTRAREMNIVIFWLFNTGIFLPLSIGGIFLTRKEPKWRAVWVSGVIAFAVAEFFNLQPYFYDNLKLFTYAFFFLSPFFGLCLDWIRNLKPLPKAIGTGIAIVLLGSQVASATLDLEAFRNGLQRTSFFTKEEFELSDQFKHLRNSADTIVLINPRHNHWVPCLTGNPVALGYQGWMWSWGINYRQREQEVQEILMGADSALNRIHDLGIGYIALEKNGRVGDKPLAFPYFEAHFKRVIDSPNWSVYSTRESAR